MTAAPPLIGLAHGSRDPRAARTIEAVMAAVAELRPGLVTRPAYLDLCEPDLAQAVAALRDEGGLERAVVLPLLFTQAFHATVDVPDAVAEAAASTGLELSVAEILGTADDVAAVLLAAAADAGVDPTYPALLFAVGSSRPEANAAVTGLAGRLGGRRPGAVRAAFGTCDPRPAEVLATMGERVALWPLFLSDGLLLDPLRRLAGERGWPLVEPLGARAADLVLARYAAARRALGTGTVSSLR